MYHIRSNCYPLALPSPPTTQGRWCATHHAYAWRLPRGKAMMMSSPLKNTSISSFISQTLNFGGSQDKPSHAEKGPSTKENLAHFHPSIWGDFFLHYNNPATTQQQTLMKEQANLLKEEVAKMISTTCSIPEKLQLIYTLERLCLDYLFEEEINVVLAQMSNADVSGCDLHTVALWFYLLRSRRYRVSSDVFAKFKDEYGRFAWSNPRDLISLYNAAHFRMHGEIILDDAISFSKRCLESMVPYLKQEGISLEIIRAFQIPIPRSVKAYEAKFYISIFENENTVDRVIIELANLNYNLVQIQHQQELKIITRWWMDLQLQADFSFSRDRIVENYFWMVGAYFEPRYSRARIILTMVMATDVMVDDLYDSYGTLQDCELFTKCIECWDRKAGQDLPGNMMLIFQKVLDNCDTIEHKLAPHEKYRMSYLRNLIIDVVRADNMKVKWRDLRYVPPTVEEHLQVSTISGGCHVLSCASLIGMGDIVTKESFHWVSSMPKMVKALCIIFRLSDDLEESYEVHCIQQEQVILDVPSTVDSCMKEHNASVESACKMIKALIEEEWKNVNEEWLNPDNTEPMELLERILNLTRTMEYMYTQEDALTTSYAVKDTINSLFVESFTEI